MIMTMSEELPFSHAHSQSGKLDLSKISRQIMIEPWYYFHNNVMTKKAIVSMSMLYYLEHGCRIGSQVAI